MVAIVSGKTAEEKGEKKKGNNQKRVCKAENKNKITKRNPEKIFGWGKGRSIDACEASKQE